MSKPRPRILIVKPILPYPPDQGTRILSFKLIKALQRDYDVTVLARILDRDEQAAADALAEHCARVIPVLTPNRKSSLHRVIYKLLYTFRSWTSGRSMKSLYDCPTEFIDAARRADKKVGGFDLVIVEYWQLYPMFDVFEPERTVLLTHDIDLLVTRQTALLEKRIRPKLKLARKLKTEEPEEVRAYQKSTRVLALTERDAHAVRKLSKGRAQVDVLPFGLDPERYRDSTVERRDDEVLFMGAMQAPFNADAVSYFATQIYPHMDDVDADVTIVGGELPDSVRWFGSQPRVSVVGRVPDVRDALARATCLVIPMRFGGGLRIRILEAMMAGVPIVCSTVAIAGMDFEPDTHFLLADDPVEFAGEVRKVLADPALAAALAEAARHRVIDLYGEEGCDRRLRALLERYIS